MGRFWAPFLLVFRFYMINTLLGTKGRMDQIFVDGVRHPVTRVKAGPCVVTQVSSEGRVQLGLGERKLKNTTKPMQGHLKAVISDNKAPRYIKEIKEENVTASEGAKVGDKNKSLRYFFGQ